HPRRRCGWTGHCRSPRDQVNTVRHDTHKVAPRAGRGRCPEWCNCRHESRRSAPVGLPTVARMTRRTTAAALLAAVAALAMTACAHASASSADQANHRAPGTGGFGAVETDPSPDTTVPATDAAQNPPPQTDPSPSPSRSGNGKGSGTGGGTGTGTGTGDGPKI